MSKDNGIFIGARALSKEQVKLIVPTYENIINQIEEIREEAKLAKSDDKKQYNNTIGLFGERGTGKSSTLYTIINELEKEKSNIVLPIIEPDIYGDNTKILGAILGVLKKEIETMESNIKQKSGAKNNFEDFYNECRFKNNNPLNHKYANVLEYYCYKEDEYRKILTQEYNDMETYKKKYSHILSPDFEFLKAFKDLLSCMIEIKRKYNEYVEESFKEPLIFLFIDDIDLKTNKCKELIDSVMQYTCHPNVICILSGDYDIFTESIILALLEKEELSKSFLLNDKEIFDSGKSLVQRKKYLANEYLKKILPPSFRHNVIKWNTMNIPKFSFNIKDSDSNSKEYKDIFLYEKLAELFGEQSIFGYKYGDETCIPSISYNIFDTTPRGLVNVFYYLSKYDEKICNNNQLTFVYVKSLIDTLVTSSSFLAKNQKKFFQEHLIWGADERTTNLNFSGNLIRINKTGSDEERNISKITEENKYSICYFLLLYCVKQLLPGTNINNFEQARELFMYIIHKNYNINEVDINIFRKHEYQEFQTDSKFQYYEKEFVYYKAVNQIIKNANFEFAIVFNEMLQEKDLHNSDVEYNRKLFNIISNLILADERNGLNVIKGWYLNRKNMSYAIRFINSYCSQDSGIEILEKIYAKLVDDISERNILYIQYNSQDLRYMQKNERNELNDEWKKKINVYEKFIKGILFKYINNIKDKEREYYKDCNGTLYKTLIKVIEKNIDSNKRKKIEKYIEKEFLEVSKVLSGKISELIYGENGIMLKFNKSMHFIEEYIKDYEYMDSRMVYSKTKKFIKIQLKYLMNNNIDLNTYIKILEKLEYLAYRSTTMYGVEESRKLIYKIMEETRVREEDLKKMIDYDIEAILWGYAKYKLKFDSNIIEKENIEDEKSAMRRIIKKAFVEVKEEQEALADEFGIEYYKIDENE